MSVPLAAGLRTHKSFPLGLCEGPNSTGGYERKSHTVQARLAEATSAQEWVRSSTICVASKQLPGERNLAGNHPCRLTEAKTLAAIRRNADEGIDRPVGTWRATGTGSGQDDDHSCDGRGLADRWRRGGDLNPRDPSESTRSPGVRLKPGSATSPRLNQTRKRCLPPAANTKYYTALAANAIGRNQRFTADAGRRRRKIWPS